MRSYHIAPVGLLLATLIAAASASAQPTVSDPNLQVQTVVSGLASPTSMAFLAPNDILVLEKSVGRVRRVLAGVLQPTPVLDVAVHNSSERGLLGIAIDTESPPRVFLYYTEVADPDGDGLPDCATAMCGAPLGNRVYRYDWNPGTQQLENPELILDLPVLPGDNHDGGIILLGPTPTPGAAQQLADDGSLLYAVIGDLNRNGQLENFPAGDDPDDTGVIFRVHQDGSAPADNPFVPYCDLTTTQSCPDGSGCPNGETCVTSVARYFSYGVRNSFGMSLDPVTGALWDTENGPGSFDEINLVEAGSNSGWERIMGPDSADPQGVDDLFDMPGAGSTYSDPEFSWLSTIAPTAILFPVGSNLGSSYDDVALVADFNNGHIYRFPLNGPRSGFDLSAFAGLTDLVADSSAERDMLLFGDTFGPAFGGITDMKLGPDGDVYVVSIGLGSIFRITGVTPTATPTPTTTATPSPSATVNIVRGNIRYYVGDGPVPGVTVHLINGMVDSAATDGAGNFEVSSISGGMRALTPEKNADFNDAVSSLDASAILQHVVGLQTLDPMRRLACDVTGNGFLSSLDAARVLQLRVGLLTHLPVAIDCGSDWGFFPVPVPTPNQTSTDFEPANPCQPGGISYQPLAGVAEGQDFLALLFGDCTGNWMPATPAAANSLRRSSTNGVHLGRPQAIKGRRIRVPVLVDSKQAYRALELDLRFDASQVRLRRVRGAEATAGAIVQSNIDRGGRVLIAVASGRPLAGSRRPALWLEMDAPRRARLRDLVHVHSATIDEVPARFE